MNDIIKNQVLNRIANGRNWHEIRGAGRAKYSVGKNIVHVRFRSDPKTDGVTYAYNINPNTLTADYEVWICGNADTYYLIPINVIEEIYNDPGAYEDKTHPNLIVADINTVSHKTQHSRLGNSKNLSPYFRSAFPSLILSRDNIGKNSPEQNSLEQDGQTTESEPISFVAADINEPSEASRISTTVYRILRDTETARKIKKLYGYKCQICNSFILVNKNQPYAEIHHIKPLGKPHNGPDIPGNILCVCPNHDVQLDYGAIKIDKQSLNIMDGHEINEGFLEYHNSVILDL